LNAGSLTRQSPLMARHVPDDFSFLPTVDSTDEEILEREALWKSAQRQAPAEPEAEQDAPAYESAAEEHPPHEPVYEEVPVVAPPPPPRSVQPPPPPRNVQPPPPPRVVQEAPPPPEPPPQTVPAKKVRLFEPDAAHAEAPEPRSDVVTPQEVALPSAKLLPPKQPPAAPMGEDEAPLPTPREPRAMRPRSESQPSPAVPPPPPLSPAAAAVLKKSTEPGLPALPRSDDDPAAKAHGSEEADGAKDPAPFIAPKVAVEEPLDPDEAKRQRWKKLAEKIGLRTLGMSFGVHVFLLLIACFIGVSGVMDKQVDFLPGGDSPQSKAAAEVLTHKIQQKKNPWLKNKPQMRKLAVQSVSANIVLPEMPPMDMTDFSKINNRIEVKSSSLGMGQPLGAGAGGAGGGFGAGIGRGAKFSFLGQTALGRRVIFVVDVSGSMSAIGQGEKISRFELLKKELNKSISQLPAGTAFQVLFFSDFAWPPGEVNSRNSEAFEKYRWPRIDGSTEQLSAENYKKAKIPTFKYLPVTPFSLQDMKKIVDEADNPGGTNWGAGLLMALNANPKPDVIFFMTDGNRSDEMGWIDIVTAENKRKLPMTTIHTSAMQQPDAAPELDTLAKRNNGKFTVVLGEGKVVKGEDYFKMKKK
jgi:hypothetical protein